MTIFPNCISLIVFGFAWIGSMKRIGQIDKAITQHFMPHKLCDIRKYVQWFQNQANAIAVQSP